MEIVCVGLFHGTRDEASVSVAESFEAPGYTVTLAPKPEWQNVERQHHSNR